VDDGTGPVTLAPGQAAVGPAAAGPLVFTGAGEAFVATAGLR
jgi:mannose-6-phosphate isomerase